LEERELTIHQDGDMVEQVFRDTGIDEWNTVQVIIFMAGMV